MQNKSGILQLILVVAWLVFTAAALAYFTLERLVDFDPDNILTNANGRELVNEIVGLGDVLSEGEDTIIHFTQDNCRCNSVSQPHVNDLASLAEINGINHVVVEAESTSFVPSTPSVAIISKIGELVYFGPYGEGLSCSKTDGYALMVMNNYLKGFSNNLIVDYAKGCYCNT